MQFSIFNFQFSRFRNAVSGSARRVAGRQGFTLVEVLVVIFFATLITSMVLVGYQKVSTSGSLQRATQRFVQDIRRAQAFAITTDPTRFSGSAPPCGYGIHLPNPATPGNPNSYVIYARRVNSAADPASIDCVGLEPQHYFGSSASTTATTVAAGVLAEAGRVRFRSSADPEDLSRADVYFIPPDPQTFLVANTNGAPIASTGPCAPIGCVRATIELADDPSQARTVFIYDSGRIEIQ